MNQTQPYLPNELARRLLDHYFFELGPNRVDIIPKRVDPRFADEYIRDRITSDAEPVVFRHARRFIDFYDLRPTLPHFQGFLSRQERDGPAFMRSVEVVMMLAEAGADADWKAADDYFQQQLLPNRLGRDALPVLLRCWADLGPRSASDQLERVFADEVSLRQKTRTRGDEAELRYQQLRSVHVNDLPRARRAVEYRRQLEQMKDDARLRLLIDNYARLDDYPPEYLNDWAARMLRRAAADADTRARIVRLARERVQSVHGQATYDVETKIYVRRRLLRAIQYFDESQLDAEDRRFLTQQLKVACEGDLLSTIQPDPALS